jgi:hypothetical protein
VHMVHICLDSNNGGSRGQSEVLARAIDGAPVEVVCYQHHHTLR